MKAEHEQFPNAFEAFLLIGLLMIIEMFVTAALIDAHILESVNDGDFYGFVTLVGNGVLFVGLMAYKRIGYRQLFHPGRNSVAATMGLVSVPILLIVPGLVFVAGTLNSIVMWLVPMSTEELSMFESMLSNNFISIFFSCIAAPVLEEMLFRGVILRSFLHRYSRTSAILLSSLLFGAAHLNVYQLAAAFSIGIVAGWLYERCRSLWPCILLHGAYNTWVTIIYAQAVEGGADSASFIGFAFVALIVGSGVLLRLLGTAPVYIERRRASDDS